MVVRSEREAIQSRRFDFYELVLEANDIGPAALHAVLAEPAGLQYGGAA